LSIKQSNYCAHAILSTNNCPNYNQGQLDEAAKPDSEFYIEKISGML
jgi:hypothetical protein